MDQWIGDFGMGIRWKRTDFNMVLPLPCKCFHRNRSIGKFFNIDIGIGNVCCNRSICLMADDSFHKVCGCVHSHLLVAVFRDDLVITSNCDKNWYENIIGILGLEY